jgi:AraC-like DNA-binding protein
VRHLAGADIGFAPHAHNAYTVATLLHGGLTGAVDGATVALAPRESVLIDAGQPHEARVVQCELLSVAIDPLVLDELLVDFRWYRPGVRPVFHGHVVADPAIATLAESLAHEITTGLPGQDEMVDALVRQLGVHLLRTHFRVRRDPAIELSRVGPVDRRLRRAIELMHARASEELSLKELAEAVFLSEHYFAHLFKEVTGFTPHAYLANVRIDRARTLLTHTDLPITRIAAEAGYRSSSHFAHAFRGVTGESPRAYRAAVHGGAAADPAHRHPAHDGN